MNVLSLRALLGGVSAGALLVAGVAMAEAAPDAATADPAPDSSPHRMHRGPIDLAQANERAARAFEKVDANADGQITQEELLAAGDDHMKGMGHRRHRGGWGHMPGAEHADRSAETFAALDKDGNGQLSSEEFARLREVRAEQMKKGAFARMDRNGDGVLSKDEFPPFTAHLKELDTDQDGKVTREELRAGKPKRFEKPADAPAEPSSENG
jgi:Ca2+-binding EF-hand superfamily protein